MRQIITFSIVVVLSTATFIAGCKKNSNPAIIPTAIPAAPDVSNFSVTPPTSFTVGNSAIIVVNSSSLTAGYYTLTYLLSVGDTLGTTQTTQTTSIKIKNGTGSFKTPVINSHGLVTIVINYVKNADSILSSVIGLGVPIPDSTGLMTLTSPGDTDTRIVDVHCSLTGGGLDISGETYHPGNDQLVFDIKVSNYNHSTGTFHFYSPAKFAPIGGSSSHSTKSGQLVGDYGEITVTATSPLLTGSFSVTCVDSTKITGTFSYPGF